MAAAAFAGAPLVPVARLTSVVVPAVTSRTQISVTCCGLAMSTPVSWSTRLVAADSNATSTWPFAAVTVMSGFLARALAATPSGPSERPISVVVLAWRSRRNRFGRAGSAPGASPSASDTNAA